MKESSKESKERKVVVAAEEKTLKEKAATTSRAGRTLAHEERIAMILKSGPTSSSYLTITDDN